MRRAPPPCRRAAPRRARPASRARDPRARAGRRRGTKWAARGRAAAPTSGASDSASSSLRDHERDGPRVREALEDPAARASTAACRPPAPGACARPLRPASTRASRANTSSAASGRRCRRARTLARRGERRVELAPACARPERRADDVGVDAELLDGADAEPSAETRPSARSAAARAPAPRSSRWSSSCRRPAGRRRLRSARSLGVARRACELGRQRAAHRDGRSTAAFGRERCARRQRRPGQAHAGGERRATMPLRVAPSGACRAAITVAGRPTPCDRDGVRRRVGGSSTVSGCSAAAVTSTTAHRSSRASPAPAPSRVDSTSAPGPEVLAGGARGLLARLADDSASRACQSSVATDTTRICAGTSVCDSTPRCGSTRANSRQRCGRSAGEHKKHRLCHACSERTCAMPRGKCLRLLRVEGQHRALVGPDQRRDQLRPRAPATADDRQLALLVLIGAADRPAERRAHGFGDARPDPSSHGRGVGDGLEDRGQVAHRHALAQQLPQHALDVADDDELRHQLLDQLRRGLRRPGRPSPWSAGGSADRAGTMRMVSDRCVESAVVGSTTV